MEFVHATKGKLRRKFTAETWNRLGKDKSGWSAIPVEAKDVKGSKKAIVPEPVKAEAVLGSKTEEKAKTETPVVVEENEVAPQGGDKKAEAVKSSSMGVPAAIKIMSTLTTQEDVNSFIEGESRVTMIAASKKHLETLN